MDRPALSAWIAGYEAAWRAPGTAGLAALFTTDATYLTAPFHEPHRGLPAIAAFWEAGRDPGEEFVALAEIIAVEGDVGVARLDVTYLAPRAQRYLDIWVVRAAPDGRCRAFEEWPFWPPGTGGAIAAGP